MHIAYFAYPAADSCIFCSIHLSDCKYLAEPDTIHPELKSTVGDSRWQDEHPAYLIWKVNSTTYPELASIGCFAMRNCLPLYCMVTISKLNMLAPGLPAAGRLGVDFIICI
jgi:hypothetical protein